MSEKQNKWLEAQTKLLKLTQEGLLEWSPYSLEKDSDRADIKIESAFFAICKTKRLKLYKYSYMVEEPGGLFGLSGGFFSDKKQKYPFWTSVVVLEFIDENGMPLWDFPQTNVLNDLFEAVKYQVAEVDEFLKEILED